MTWADGPEVASPRGGVAAAGLALLLG